jgi:hypothetical protein
VIDEGAEASLYNGKVVRAKRAHDCNGSPSRYLARQVFRAGPGKDAASAASDVRDTTPLVATSIDATASDYGRAW